MHKFNIILKIGQQTCCFCQQKNVSLSVTEESKVGQNLNFLTPGFSYLFKNGESC